MRQAHPPDSWHTASHDIHDPTTIDERRGVAGQCETAMQYGIGTYVGEMDDAVITACAAHPDRLYLVDVDGRVAYAGGRGPFGFDPGELKEAVEEVLER